LWSSSGYQYGVRCKFCFPSMLFCCCYSLRGVLGNSRTQTHTNLHGSATCLLHGATGLY
jgi:hypothetical protein